MNENDSVLGLATIRRNRGVSLEDIAEATKISIRALRAIEVGEFQKLPGGIYNTSYIRQYAKAIDFDASTILEYYYRKTGASTAQTRPEDGPPRDNKNKGVFGGVRPSALLGL